MKKKKHKKIEKRRQAKAAKKRSKKQKNKKQFNIENIDLLPFENQETIEPELNFKINWDQVIIFDEKNFRIVYHSIPASYDEESFIYRLKYFDSKLVNWDDSFNYNQYLNSISIDIPELFFQWCLEKGIERETSQLFTECVDLYFSYIYQHKDTTFRMVDHGSLDEFFISYFKIESAIDLTLFSFSLKALELLYRFLNEKNYVQDVADLFYTVHGHRFIFYSKLEVNLKKRPG